MATATALETTSGPAALFENGDVLYEVINGQCVEKPASAFAVTLGGVLAAYLWQFVLTQKLGVVVAEVIFRLGQGGNQRRPDVAFVAYGRWSGPTPPHTDPWEVVPNLAVEVVSPTNRMEDILDKIDEYFAAGVQLVWVILPKHRRVYVYYSPFRIHVLGTQDELDGETVLPGFRLAVSALFEPLTKPAQP